MIDGPAVAAPTHAFGPFPLMYLGTLERARVLGIPVGISMAVLAEPPRAMAFYLEPPGPTAYKFGIVMLSRCMLQSRPIETQLDIHAATLAIDSLWKPEYNQACHLPTPQELIEKLLCVDEDRWRRACGKYARLASKGPPSIDLQAYCRQMGEKLNPLAVRCWLLGQLDTFARMCEATKNREQADELLMFVDALLGKLALL